MGWATPYIQRLRAGEIVSFRPRGNSMVPIIQSGQLCTVEPANHAALVVGDVVLCKVGGAEYLHLIKDLLRCLDGDAFQIGNNHGRINGWVSPGSIFGRLILVEE